MSIIKGRSIFAGYEINEDNVKQMLTFMGVEPTTKMVSDAIGYLSSNSMEINMINLDTFLKEKDIIKDLR